MVDERDGFEDHEIIVTRWVIMIIKGTDKHDVTRRDGQPRDRTDQWLIFVSYDAISELVKP
jgi:hypothetical protein